jgi:hypothetical protein
VAPRWAAAFVLPKTTPLWTNEMANPQTDTRVYPDDLLPQLQQALGTLANLQIRYEIERDYLEDWPGSAEVKDRLVVELNQCHAVNRGGLVSCLAQLQREAQESRS